MRLRTLALSLGAIVVLLSGGLLAQVDPPDDGFPLPDFLQDLPPQVIHGLPMQRFLYNYRMRANPDGSPPNASGARTVAAIAAATPTTANRPPFSTVANMRWQNVGARPVVTTSLTWSGRVTAIAVHPQDPRRWLIGAANGGVWETTDGGDTFSALTDDAPTLAIGAIAYAPNVPNMIYAGTGEANFAEDSFGGEGILSSTDGGKKWKQVAADAFPAGFAFSDIRVHPGDPNTLVAAVSLGSFGRIGALVQPTTAQGLFISHDRGNHWTQTQVGQGTSLDVDPTDFSRQYAGIGKPFADPLNGVYRSTDAGQTWTPVPGPWMGDTRGVGRVELAVAPSNSDRVYVTVQDAFNNGPNDGGLLGLWTTANAWAANPTWTPINLAPTDNGSGTMGPCGWTGSSSENQCWYNLVLSVKPTDENLLFFGGVRLWRYNRGTNTWVNVSQSSSGTHVDYHSLVWTDSRLIAGSDGGVWSSTDDGSTWANHNATLAISQYYEGSLGSTPNLALAGSQDDGTQVWKGMPAWTLTLGGDGGGNFISTATNWGASASDGLYFRTTNGGLTWAFVTGNYRGTPPFIGKMRECPSSPGTAILTGTRVNKTTNFFFGPANALWSDRSGNFGRGPSTAIAFGANCNIYALGFLDGTIDLTFTDSPPFYRIDPLNQVPDRPISSIVFDPNNGNRMIVALNGFSNTTPQNIFTATFDQAQVTISDWTNISVPVDGPVNSLAIDPANSNRIFAGTDFGIWLTTDGGLTWAHMGYETGMPNVPVFDIAIRGGRVMAFTHGRGAFALANFDLNGDGEVNCQDIAIVRTALHKGVGDAGYNIAADLNGDNIVDNDDLTMMTHQQRNGGPCSTH